MNNIEKIKCAITAWEGTSQQISHIENQLHNLEVARTEQFDKIRTAMKMAGKTDILYQQYRVTLNEDGYLSITEITSEILS